jgi:16S rRNA (guanine966-N2)-methyltransferase
MRVIAGKYRSRPLQSLRGVDIRPTADRLRETLFNVLTAGDPEALWGSVWIDLFAGTGAVGIEALSRGAQKVYFVENSREAGELIQANLRSLQIGGEGELLQVNASKALATLSARAIAADFAFLDPPYRMEDVYGQILGPLASGKLLKPNGIVISEHEKRFDPGENFAALRRYRILKQGDAALSFYRRSDS